MSLLDDARAAAAQPGQLCSVLKAEIAQPKQWADLCQAIRDHTIPAPALVRACRDHGIDGVTAHTIMRHRQGQCIACQRRGLSW
jgi:hypothetical protein